MDNPPATGFTLMSILFKAEARALLRLAVLFNILCCIAICIMLVLADKINNKHIWPKL